MNSEAEKNQKVLSAYLREALARVRSAWLLLSNEPDFGVSESGKLAVKDAMLRLEDAVERVPVVGGTVPDKTD